MTKRPGKPSERRIKDELTKLRRFIECPEQDQIAMRLAQVAEDAIRWVTEETDWDGPLDDVEKVARYFVLVWMPSGNPIPPFDCNPGHEDEGMLVYRSKESADAAASHQQEMYGGDETAMAIPLSQLGMKVSR